MKDEHSPTRRGGIKKFTDLVILLIYRTFLNKIIFHFVAMFYLTLRSRLSSLTNPTNNLMIMRKEMIEIFSGANIFNS